MLSSVPEPGRSWGKTSKLALQDGFARGREMRSRSEARRALKLGIPLFVRSRLVSVYVETSLRETRGDGNRRVVIVGDIWCLAG